jgi:uncharacterized protein YfaS (alpha-2-macroglobulin family)
MTITAVAADGTTTALPTTGTAVRTAAVADGTSAVRFGAPSAGTLFYQLTETGFDRAIPAEAVANGLEVTREIRGADGKPATRCSITDRLTVELAVRSTDDATREVALVDLLPGGFEVDLIAEGMQSRTSAGGGAERWQPDYVDAREDRVVLYGNVGRDARRFAYRIKPTNRGRYLVPPVQVEGFYDRAAWGRGPGGEIVVGD